MSFFSKARGFLQDASEGIEDFTDTVNDTSSDISETIDAVGDVVNTTEEGAQDVRRNVEDVGDSVRQDRTQRRGPLAAVGGVQTVALVLLGAFVVTQS